jgi:uncharacterized repeat protein (TIGR02543 family)
MRKLRTATIVLFMLSMIGLAGCSNFLDNAKNINPADAVETAKNKLALGFASGDSAPAVTHGLTLATTGDDGVSISWISSNTSVVSNAGAVTRPAFGQPDAVVTLTATITKGAITETKTFEIHVAAYPDSSHADVLAAKDSLVLVFSGDDTADSVTEKLTLSSAGANGVAISWATSDTAFVGTAGHVTRPGTGQPDKVVTLTATITKGTETETKTFTVTVKAQPYRYTVAYDGNGNTQGAAPTDLNSYLANADVTAAAQGDLLKTGYSFVNWNTRSDGTGTDYAPSASFQMPGESLILYAKWTAKTYTVAFNAQGGTAASPASTVVTYASTYGALATTTRTGYSFDGWYTVSGGTGTQITASSLVNITANQTLYAKWTANTNTAYSVQYYQQDLSGGGYTLHETESLSGTTGATATAVAKSYTGFAENTGHASRVASGTIAGDGSLVLKLYYDRSTYTVSYSSDGGSAVSATTGVRYGATISAPTAPTKTGYTFSGWYKEAGLTNVWTFASDTVTAATTLYAKWTANANTAYSVQHYQQDVSGSGYKLHETESLSGTTGATATAVAKSYTGFAENTGYASRVASGTIAADGSLMLKLYYDRSTYTVSYSSNGGSAVSATTGVRYGATISAPTAPTKTGYTFSGWYKEAGLTNAWTFASDTVAAATTLYAKWTALPTYTVTYSANGSGSGTAPSDANSYLAGASATVLGNTGSLYKKGGYYFDGWNTDASGTGTDYAAGAALSIQGNLTLYAKWSKYVVTKHVVIFRDDGSEWLQPATYGTLLTDELGMSEGSGIAKYEYKTSADIPTYTPTVGDILIVAASQPTAFYNAYRTDKAKFDSFVNAGGVMFWVYADCGMPWGKYDSELPGGVLKSYSAFENYDDIVNSTHPITAGIASTHFYGSQASAGGFSNLDSLVSAGTISHLTTLIVQSNNRLPSLVEYTYGSGKVIAATVILDYYVSSSKRDPYYTIAVNSLKYLLGLI